MSTKHTPGPWNVRGFIVHQANMDIAQAFSVNRPPQLAEANARLIAAAPDLLAALKALVGTMNDRPDLRWPRLEQPLSDARSAITKATGQ